MYQQVNGRLPQTVRPHVYLLTLTVIPEDRRFGGQVIIEVEIDQPTREIVLHALELNLSEAEIRSGDRVIPARISVDAASEMAILTLPEVVGPGSAEIFLTFSGRLNTQMRGLYEARSGGQIYAFTQFEATDARRMFPCFDEPAMKARFRLTVCAPADLTVLSNMPRIGEKSDGRFRTVSFDETPVMSTYLLALAVARLDGRTIRIGATSVTAWTLPHQQHLADFALKVTAGVLPLLNDYFDLPYPLPNLDLVGVPDFAMGAMENWGLIFFRDSRMLVDEARASTSTLRDVANVITHEIVHQWFGNLVTMRWWDDLWLNEAFATWLAVKIVDQWRPEWNAWVEFQQEKQVPLAIDALKHTRPIHAEVTHAAEIEEMFDALTYEKGAACLRMIEWFVGEAAFRSGIRRYISAHQYQNAEASALWAALAAASSRPVAEMAHDWFSQAGFPQITLRSIDGEFRRLSITQQRFQATGDGTCTTCWTVPFVVKYSTALGISEHPVLLTEPTTEVTLPTAGPVEWVYGNAAEAGFLRVNYGTDLRGAISSVVRTALSPEERIGFLSHLWVQMIRGDIDIADFMTVLIRFQGDTTRVVIQEAAAYLEVLSDRLVLPTDRPHFEAWAGRFFAPVWKRLGWQAKGEEDDEARMSRAAALWALGALAKAEEILSELPRRQTLYWANPASLDPTLATPLIRLCARIDGGSQFGRYIEKFKTAETPEERDRYLTALSDFQRPDLAVKLLEFVLSDDVRGQDISRPIRGLLGNPNAQEVTWVFIQKHWSDLRRKGGSVGAQRIIQATKALWRLEWREEVARFFNHPDHRVDAAKRTLAQTVEFIDIGLRFKSTQQARLSAYLNKN